MLEISPILVLHLKKAKSQHGMATTARSKSGRMLAFIMPCEEEEA